MKKKEARILATALLTGSTLLAAGHVGAAPVDSDRSSAAREIQRVGSDVRQEAEKNAKPMDMKNMNVRVSAIIVQGVDSMSEKTVRALLPELSRETVNIRKLSQEIQSVNDTGAVLLSTEFTPAGAGAYRVTVKVQEQKSDHVRLSVSNTGTDETGDWRTSLTYLNTNISGRADTLGVAFVTSPGRFGDVKVGALSYRKLMPQWKGAISASVSHGRTSIDNYPTGTSLYDLNIGGKSTNADFHYQRHISYTSRNKDILDFGIGYRRTESDYSFTIGGTPLKMENDYRVLLASATYLHSERKANSALSYNIGIAANIGGDAKEYENLSGGGVDRQFTLLRAGINYQARTAGDWIGAVRLNGQYTRDHIVPSEQLGAGGQMSVRGFDERAIGADKGFVGSLEIYTPEIAPHTRLLAFTDYAYLSNNKNSANRNTVFDSDSIASAGLGVRYADGQFSLALDYATILRDADKVNLTKQNSRHWNLMVSVNF